MLADLAPDASESSLEEACYQVWKAVDFYLLLRQGTDDLSADHDLSGIDKELGQLERSLQDLQSKLSSLSVGAQHFVRKKPQALVVLDEGRVSLDADRLNSAMANLEHVLKVGRRQAAKLRKRDFKPEVYLAYRVRVTLTITLGLKAAKSARYTADRHGKGANYRRLLDLSFSLAGVDPPNDPRALMDKGELAQKELGENVTT